ncbi:MAG: 23S rRNA (adenine(2503)-C(2))-methyltransferase RlmN [Saprospiraceae bacterium]|nr:23S rRNA (adenine(2503)-C(2))-methyltransferase RlmN [Saprospiraceae bacterium]
MENLKKDLLNISPEDLQSCLSEMGWEKFRHKQLQEWLWKRAVRDFESMSNLSKTQRQQLSEQFFIPALTMDKQQESSDGTMKFRFRTYDGFPIESVLIPVEDDKRFTICVSSQSGCSLSCAFCATGTMGLLRQLTASEIADQFYAVNSVCEQKYGRPLSNVVYMGMGEPLLNYKNVMKSIEILCAKEGLALSPKRITLSTAGISKMIKKLADDGSKVNLALSLHAADDLKRNKMMAINESNNLNSLMEALRYFYKKTGNRISYEYIAFEGFNDTVSDAKNLIRMCSHFPVKVNIIEYNPVKGMDFIKSTEDHINSFAKEVRKHGIMITVRRSRGKDIDAACGQLAVEKEGS